MAKILTTEEMAVYLKQAMELEASVYTQDRALTESKRTLEKSTPNKKKVFQSTVREPKEPQTSPVNIDGMVKGHRTSMVLGSILLVLGLIFVIIAWSDYHHGGLIAPGLIMVIIGILFLLSQKNYKTRLGNAEAQKIKNDELIASYNKEKAEYPAKKAESERKYKADLQEAETSFQEATHRHEIATAAADQLLVPYRETKEALRKLYALDILFPKYRNLVAVSTMYEYFASGRVTTLEGPDGAYNLYESELRLNLIINKMDVIIKQLEDIKANQYALYNELQQTNEILSGIASDVSELVSTTHEIADASRITAYCSQVTAQNTEALKYIALVNG